VTPERVLSKYNEDLIFFLKILFISLKKSKVLQAMQQHSFENQFCKFL